MRGLVRSVIVLIAPPHIPYAPAFARYGIDPGRVIVVESAEDKNRWWSAEQVLRADSRKIARIAAADSLTSATCARASASGRKRHALGRSFHQRVCPAVRHDG